MEQVEALMIIEIQSYKTEKCRNCKAGSVNKYEM